jgi:hypothetical protein
MMATKPRKSTPAKRTEAKAAPAAPAADEAAQDEAQAVEQVPMNRAERRAKGRGKGVAQSPGAPAKVTGGHGPGHTQRNWANRRTG